MRIHGLFNDGLIFFEQGISTGYTFSTNLRQPTNKSLEKTINLLHSIRRSPTILMTSLPRKWSRSNGGELIYMKQAATFAPEVLGA
jgi:hypothetical protein